MSFSCQKIWVVDSGTTAFVTRDFAVSTVFFRSHPVLRRSFSAANWQNSPDSNVWAAGGSTAHRTALVSPSSLASVGSMASAQRR